jgi:D-alanyl-lipoteichoic acid acyltransferase DltB (MBOAT superfamily)
MFFPQLVAGPIERPGNLLPQFRVKHDFDYDRVKSGIILIAWGIFKKVVIADRLAIAVETVYNNPHAYNSLSLIIASLFFAFEVYCDFSGYADIAIGSARILGFKLMNNFDYPFLSQSFSEFWRRWHISLSSWFRDYVYFPLGGNRVSAAKWYRNIMIVFLISGLWHGASWNYVLFGAIQGFYIIFGRFTMNVRKEWKNKLRLDKFSSLPVITTFLLLVFSLIFFRASTLNNATYIISKIFTDFPVVLSGILKGQPVIQDFGLNNFELILSFVLIIFLETVQYWHRKIDIIALLKSYPLVLRWSIYYAGLAAILFLGVFENRQFIYFQF